MRKAEAQRKQRLEESTVDVNIPDHDPVELQERAATERKRKEVQEILDGPSRKQHQQKQAHYNEYVDKLAAVGTALQEYKTCLNGLVHTYGSDYLQDLREGPYNVVGPNWAARDFDRVNGWKDDLIKIAELLTTQRGQTRVNFDDPNLIEVNSQ